MLNKKIGKFYNKTNDSTQNRCTFLLKTYITISSCLMCNFLHEWTILLFIAFSVYNTQKLYTIDNVLIYNRKQKKKYFFWFSRVFIYALNKEISFQFTSIIVECFYIFFFLNFLLCTYMHPCSLNIIYISITFLIFL